MGESGNGKHTVTSYIDLLQHPDLLEDRVVDGTVTYTALGELLNHV